MVRVVSIGAVDAVRNPRDGSFQNKVNVVFVEDSNRGGLNTSLSNSSKALANVLGIANAGITLQRTHTEPMNPEAAAKLKIGQEFPQLFINRTLTSYPAMKQQIGVAPRMVDDKPTFVNTELGTSAIDDVDKRVTNETLAETRPEFFAMATTGTAEVYKNTNAEEAAQRTGGGSLVSSALGSKTSAE